MKLAISGETLSRTMPLEKILEICKSHGVVNFELWALNCEPESSNVHPMTFKNRDILKAKRLFKEYDVNVACVAFGGAFHRELVENVEVYSREFTRSVEVAAELGAGIVNHYCNHICHKPDVDVLLLDKYYGNALKRAEDLGVILTLENEAHDMTRTPENMLKIVQGFNSINFRTNFDATNYYQAGSEGFPGAYEILKDFIMYIHIKNGCVFNPAYGHWEECMGETMTGSNNGKYIYYPTVDKGAVNIAGLLDRLKNDGYTGYCTLEPHTPKDIALRYYRDEIMYLRRLGFF